MTEVLGLGKTFLLGNWHGVRYWVAPKGREGLSRRPLWRAVSALLRGGEAESQLALA